MITKKRIKKYTEIKKSFPTTVFYIGVKNEKVQYIDLAEAKMFLEVSSLDTREQTNTLFTKKRHPKTCFCKLTVKRSKSGGLKILNLDKSLNISG